MKKVLFTATVDSHIKQFHTPYLKWFKEQGYEVHVASNGNNEIEYCDKHYDLPFENPKNEPKYGKGVKLNDLNSVLVYIIELTESQKGYLSHQDLDTFLIRFASKYPTPSKIPELVRIKIFEGFTNCLKFFSDYKTIRNERRIFK